MNVKSANWNNREIAFILENGVNSADFGIWCRRPFEASSAFEFMRSTFC